MSDDVKTPDNTEADSSTTPGSTGTAPEHEYPDYRQLQTWLFGFYLVVLWVLIVFTFAGYWPRVEESRVAPQDSTKISAPPADTMTKSTGPLVPAQDVETIQRTISDTVRIYYPGYVTKPFRVPLEKRLIILALLAGMLGAWIHVAISFTNFVGSRSLRWSWGWWYVLRPFIGGAIALLVYFALRAGLLNGTGSAVSLSIHGIVAICGLVGWFSRKAAERLEEVMETALGASARPLKDPINKGGPKPEEKQKDEKPGEKDTRKE